MFTSLKTCDIKVGKNDFRNSKDQNGLLNNISFQVLVEPYSHYGRVAEYHFGNRDKDYDFSSNRIRKYGKCCPLWTTLHIIIYNHFKLQK